ncbi:phosphonate C-P lyase system protein PhnG [uncultured Enterovirga sp.]|uniref:phosphonate C-P lyase system protein PhnG n=1 Tax=uncultured Enterovirga sp. TaxID=2026352 RepID=UPI0035CB9317
MDTAPRQAVMALCAEATRAELDAALLSLGPLPPIRDLRPVENGSVMLRGRAGGDGAVFNLGEATVSRAAVSLVDGSPVQGFAYHLGRDLEKTRQAATLDALWQLPARRGAVEAALAPVRNRILANDARAERRAAATRVNFFTLARGED